MSVEYLGSAYGGRQCGAVLHPSAKTPGYWQVTRFDEDGFIGDTQYATQAEAERELKQDRYVPQEGLLSRLAMTKRFSDGNDKTQLVRLINMGGDHMTLCAAFERGGIAEARRVYSASRNPCGATV